ncbi:fucosyltransferase 4 (alpha (1,3) fucosyltransferase, myeloid-specific) [Columba livia]|uniref:Fucosyltransferase 4 (Alpha (1,3) fucosyltransferase, myeloid-specific) n=1 Tax=Columba livia TaxID=8932 RepID=A0A2I0LVS7_COLLI|nr:fucosyltransferase 4 (alpha (1,3) fucosyltransferase, myeloid-specific) [Columba livia]
MGLGGWRCPRAMWWRPSQPTSSTWPSRTPSTPTTSLRSSGETPLPPVPCPLSSALTGPTTSASSPPTPSSMSMTSPAPGCWPST